MFMHASSAAIRQGLLAIAVVAGTLVIFWPRPLPAMKRGLPSAPSAALATPSTSRLQAPSGRAISPAPADRPALSFAPATGGAALSSEGDNSARPVTASGRSSPDEATRANFQKVQLGQHKADVRKLLGRPTSMASYSIKDEEIWSWEFFEADEDLTFRVIFSEEERVIWAGTSLSEGVDILSRER